LSAVAAWAARHAKAVLAVALLLAIGSAVAATRLPTDARTSTLVDTDTASYRATQEVRRDFGEEPVVVLAEGDLEKLVLTPNLGRLLRLEGCLSADPPKGVRPIPGPCAELAAMRPVRSVVGPATFLNEAVIQIDRQLKRLVATTPPAQLRELLLSLASRYGITSAPSISNPNFLAAIVFDLNRARDTPKARLAYLFPNGHSAQVIVRLRADLSEAERHRAIGLIRAVVEDATPNSACRFKGRPEACFALHGGRYVISGVPVVVDAVTPALKDALLVLFAAAVVVMALTLLLVFRSRFRLLPLALALAAAALTFGLLSLVGGSLTMASIAVLPVLIGLAVDYAIQLQARYDEALDSTSSLVEAARLAASRAGPTIATACLATAAGFLALLLSPTPMVRGFGLLMVVGIAIAFVLALTAGFAALALRTGAGRRGVSPRVRARAGGVPPVAGFFALRRAALAKWSVRKTGRRGREGHPRLTPQRAVDLAVAEPRKVLGVGLALAVIGWGLGTQISAQSDIRQLAPQSLGAVKDLNELQDATGVSGELEMRVTAPDLTDPATIRWMAAFKRRALEAGGFSGSSASCREAEICPGPALSDFVTGGEALPEGEAVALKKGEIRAALRQIPRDDLRQVATVDPKTGLPAGSALVSFGIRAQSLDQQQALIDRVRGAAGKPGEPGGPPPGVEVQPAGVPVIAAAAASDLSSSRYLLTLVGLLAVALVLFVVYRSPRRVLVAIAPPVLASGWAALILWLTRIPLNPMSAALGALTIAIATEFSVILSGRFHEERGGGLGVVEALRAAYARTGAAVLASGITAIAGFAVLIVSEVGMLRDFGLVTVIDLTVALAGVMVALPAALTLAELPVCVAMRDGPATRPGAGGLR
jgi:hydrophobe/amphiphile efflux-3 (HAE3) family protein